jgi:cyclic pyranopterin phosphate synthase
MDSYQIDSHKLMYHVCRVHEWLNGRNIYPIYMEIGPSGSCNHRCTYCGLDFMKYQKRFLDTEILKQRLTEMGRLGLKSIMYAGEGEPFLHKDLPKLICHTKQSGIDVAITTNAVLFKPQWAEEIMAHTTWIKASIDGATPKTYAQIHRTREEDFHKVIRNMTHAVERRRVGGYPCTLGTQLLL